VNLNFLWILLGAGLIFWGKKLFWILLGAAGFLLGFTQSQSIIQDQPIWFYLVVAAVCAALVVAAIKLLKNIAFGLGGFVAGAYVANGVLNMLKLELGTLTWVVIIVCGVVGAILMLTLFEWALIILSSTAGAMLVTQSLPKDLPGIQILFFGLILLGFIVQVKKSRPGNYPKNIPPLPPEIQG
jgi:hypothetical protein